MAAVVVFAAGVGGFLVSLGAFSLFAGIMGVSIFLLAFLGATSGPSITRSIRIWGRKVQAVAGLALVLVGFALIYSGIDPGVYRRLLLE